MIGWYVHGHGSGHAQRLASIAPHLRAPVTVLSSLPRPADAPGDWLELADDLPTGADGDVTAGGTLHWAPRHHPGLRERSAAVAAWVEQARPALVVVDVSVERPVRPGEHLPDERVAVAVQSGGGEREHRVALRDPVGAEQAVRPWAGRGVDYVHEPEPGIAAARPEPRCVTACISWRICAAAAGLAAWGIAGMASVAPSMRAMP